MHDQIATVNGRRCQLLYIILSHVSRLGIILLMHQTGRPPKHANHHQHAISEQSWVDNMERCRSCLRALCRRRALIKCLLSIVYQHPPPLCFTDISLQVRTREISCVPVSADTHVSRRDAIVAGGSTMLAGFLLLLPSDDAEARTKNPEVTKKLKEAIEKVKVKANQSFEGAKGAAKQAKASVKATVAKK